MLEGLATWVLNNYLGQYLENLHTHQLSIGLLKGEVELENVPLRKDALRHLDMPLEVRTGFVGKVKLQIPVSRLRSEPWVIIFEKLFLVAGPVKLNEYDEEAEEAASQGRKISQLDGLEAAWRSDLEARNEASHYASSYTSWLSYGTSFMTNIIENIQLKIRDVHIRYEDDQSFENLTNKETKQIFSFGMTIDSLALQSSDAHWIPRFVYGGDSKMAYKLLELTNLGFYWDTKAEVYSNKTLDELQALMLSSINKRDHEYILSPVSAAACVKRNLSEAPLRSRSSPRITCDLKLESFPLTLSDEQYHQMLKWNKEYDCLEKARHHRKWRPHCSVKDKPSDWWQYAIQVHVDKINKKYSGRNWSFVCQRANDIVKYVSIYKEHLKNPAIVTTECKSHKMLIEQELNFEELRCLREIAMEQVGKEQISGKMKADNTSSSGPLRPDTVLSSSREEEGSAIHSGEGVLQRWFPAYMGWYYPQEETISGANNEGDEIPAGQLDDASVPVHSPPPEAPPPEPDLIVPNSSDTQKHQHRFKSGSPSLEEELLYVLSDSMENNTFMKRDVVLFQLSFTLRRGTFSLSSYKPLTSKPSSHDTNINTSETSQESKNERVELFVLEFDSVKMSVESRPRSKSFKFDIELGSVILKDKFTVDSAFPQLVCPQNREGGKDLKAAMSRTSTMYAKITNILAPAQKQALNQGPLFALTYEAKPFGSKADHRLVVNSNALDIVYNPSALEEIKSFFTSPYQREEEMEQLSQMSALGTAAKKRYEELKEQTKQELKKNWEQMMEGSMLLRKRWDIQLNISAPQIILPEHFHDRNATLVVLDFGKLIFCSAQPMSNTKLNDEIEVNSDDEDEFATPCSTPDELETNSLDDMEAKLGQGFPQSDNLDITESALHDHMYDRYDLKLCDMQVIVGKVRDNWRFAYVKGTGHMHVLDRFSISLQMERRVVMLRGESGQQWPSATLAGTLPSLVVHINEQKVLALRTMVKALAPPKPKINKNKGSEASAPYFSADDLSGSTTLLSIDDPASDNSRKTDSPNIDDGKLFVMQFTVDKLSLELQSRGRSIAELQVTGVKANFTKRPYETSSTLSVHSLLLVDALQTFGPDFELLVASHKHVSMDSVSGSLLDSEPCSPTSPASPDPFVQPLKPTSPLILSQAISSLAAARAVSPPKFPRIIPSSPPNLRSPLHAPSDVGGASSSSSSRQLFQPQESRDSEALITVEITYVSANCPTQQATGALLLASVQFNTLDIIANQETVVELVGFVQQLFPHSPSHPLPYTHTTQASPSSHDATDGGEASPKHSSADGNSIYNSHPSLYYVAPEKSPVRAEVRFDFHKLTVLLLRGMQKDIELIGRKVGTAVLSDAKIEATVEQDILTVEGSLGGFQVRDVTPEGNKHQCIISVGQDPVVERSQDVLSRLNSELYRSYSMNEATTRAFSFTVIRPLAFSDITGFHGETPSDASPTSDSGIKDDPDNLTLKLRLASVCYTHSPHFLRELHSCATEFKQYMARVASSIKHAATEMAIGLVSKRIERFAGLSSGNWESSPRHRQRLMSTSRSTDTLNLPAPPPASGYTSHFSPVMDEANDLPFNLSLDIILETPVVVLPESPNSPDVLVAHLGQISIANSPAEVQQPAPALMALPPSRVSEYRVVVRDMSLFSLNVEERLRSQNYTFQGMSSHMMNAEDLYSCMDHGRPILHSTTVELYCRHEQDPYLLGEHQSGLFLPSDFFIDLHQPMSRDSVQIDGGIITPLKISVTRQQYWLILRALSNLSYIPHETLATQKGLSSISEEDPSSVSSQSAANLSGLSTSQTAREKPTIAIKGSFSVPSLCIELRGDVGIEKEKPLVNLLLEDLKATYESCEPYKTRTQVTLESLKMEDLQYLGPKSSHRMLMTSECGEAEDDDKHQQHHTAYPIPTQSREIPQFISTSAPEAWQHQPHLHQHNSLPDRVTMEKPYFQDKHRPQAKLCRGVGVQIPGAGSNAVGAVGCSANVNRSPCTPPPSPTPEDHQQQQHNHVETTHNQHHSTLVNITISTIDKKSPDFYSKYDGTNRYVDVDFNSLVTVINIPSWVMVVDFFTMDQDQSTPSQQTTEAVTPETNIPDYKVSEELNTIMEIQVKSLTLILNKPEFELARARVSQVLVRSVGSEGNLTLTGRLGSLSLVDCTPIHGNLYRERFLTHGSEAMTFQIFRYGHPDPNVMRECDIRVKIKMSSVLYMHTQRFSMELLQFVQQFNQLRDIMSKWRATSQGIKVSDFSRGARVSLDISAGSPVIFLPMSGYSKNLMVADLGSLTITNKFLWAGTTGTISQVQRQDLKDRLMVSGKFQQRTGSSSRQPSASHRSRSRSHSRHRDASLFLSDSEAEGDTFNPSHKCLLDVMYIDLVNMDLYTSIRTSLRKISTKTTCPNADQVEWVFGSYRIERQGCSLLKDKCALKLQVERNLDSMICHSVPDMSVHGMLSKVHATVNLSQYKIIRGLLMYNLGEQLPEPQVPMYPYQQATDQGFGIFGESGVWTGLKIHIDLDNVMLELEVEDENMRCAKRLAAINYIKSRLVYESFSDSSKDVDLVSQEILINDTRFEGFPVNKRSNIFTNILQPTISKAKKNDSLLQAEVHYRSTKDVTRFTILLNNMRLMGILDWWAEVQEFIDTQPENPFTLDGSRLNDVFNKVKSSSQATSPLLLSPFPSPLNTPLTQSPPPLSPRPSSPCCTLQERRSATPKLNPMVESTGVMTKHALIHDSQQIPFEIKLNITDSELVLLESTDVWDTSAVILKSTAVISYRPHHTERPLSCNLNQCELYSCILGLEEDTALSIIDPVTVNIEVNDRAPKSPDIDISIATQHTVEVVLHQLNIRLSYHDMKMFQQILESVPKQQKTAVKNKSHNSQQPANFQAQVNKLSVLGFLPSDCMKALEECQGRLDDAALWLTHNAQPAPLPTLLQPNQSKEESINFQAIEVKTGGVNICIIDDCGDCDVPLLEISLSHLGLKQDWEGKGAAACNLSVDYYNRYLSGWEPFLEPWKCSGEWSKCPSKDLQGKRLNLQVEAQDTVNINLTSTVLELYHMVKNNWTQDYYNRESSRVEMESSVVSRDGKANIVSPQGYRRRSPFIPFALKNDTGCNLCFATLTSTPDSMVEADNSGLEKVSEEDWMQVAQGGTLSFSFQGRGKQRHRDTRELKVHQLLVRVEGWGPVGPVTVDKVGVFFRLAPPQTENLSVLYSDLPSARVVMEVTLEGSARKLITVRSALLLTNKLPCSVDIKLDNITMKHGETKIMQVSAHSSIAVPLMFAWSRLYVRPINPCGSSSSMGGVGGGGGFVFCQEPLHWFTLVEPHQETANLRLCPAINTHLQPYRFCVQVKRDNFPKDTSNTGTSSVTREWIQPGHSIVLMSPLTVVNLLPCEVHYTVKQKTSPTQGRIKPGGDAHLHSIDPQSSITMNIWTDTLTSVGEFNVVPSTSIYVISVKLYDAHKRVLHLHIKVRPHYGGAVKVSVYAAYWLINKIGLPLIFKQEGGSYEAAGQDAEHELARCAAPLMFSFSDRDAVPLLMARVGKMLHQNAKPQYCHKLPLTQGTWVRRLRVSPQDSRPDWVYIVGVDVRPGRGRYRDTYMVTISPRFQIENRSSHKLQIAQKGYTSSFNDPAACSTWLTAIPGCWLPFHWPRLDKEQLLCLRLQDVPNSHWSGGFPIEMISSFHLNIRNAIGQSYFVRVEIIINDATYFIVFTDAESIPPPFRIDNYSEVPITYYQTGTQEERLRTVVKSHSSIHYAWDEVMLQPHLTCVAPGGTSATYNLNVLGEGAKLTYENFIYIATTATFKKRGSGSSVDGEEVTMDPTSVECQQLVLDVPEGTRVILARKELGRRSQLWRMTATGMLQHEGSSPPHDPSTRRSSKTNNNILVLDIAGPAPQPNSYTPLMLRKPDERRRLTQTWRFTDDGQLCCLHVNLFVQAKDGFPGLTTGNDVVLGPPQLVHYDTMANGVPYEQAISREKLRPGSGLLAVKVVTDGPTRVLQIMDVHSKSTSLVARTECGDWLSTTQEGGTTSIRRTTDGLPLDTVSEGGTLQEIQVSLKMSGGLGLSIVQRPPPQELVYIKLTDIVAGYQSTAQQRVVDCSIRDIQVDNQLIGAQCPITLYVTPQNKNDESRHGPALFLTAHQIISPCTNAVIFKHLMLTLKNLTLTLEEELLFKLLMLGYDQSDSELSKVEEQQYDMRRMLAAATSVNCTRYYFTHLKLLLNQVRLSVLTSKRMSPELKKIKHKMGLTLVRFENAQVNLDPFVRYHPFETSRFLLDCITNHYREELKSQALRILGSTDFLGNPFGFLADVSEGVTELVNEGSVGGLMWNVTHGMANSTAKVTGSISDAVVRVTMDDRHEESRIRLRQQLSSGSADHFVAGLRGLGLGIYGGLTSIVSQTYTGASAEGLPGFFSGFAKGMVGTVTKPAIGFLDLASGTASAVRDTSKNPEKKMPGRIRKPRLVIGLNGMMPRFSSTQADGQELLLSFSQNNEEIFLGYEVLRQGEEDLRVLISSNQVRVFSQIEASLPPTIVLNVSYTELYSCRAVVVQMDEKLPQKHYIELTMCADKGEVSGVPQPSQQPCKRPKVRCDSRAISQKVCQQINYSRNLHEELRQTVFSKEEDNEDD